MTHRLTRIVLLSVLKQLKFLKFRGKEAHRTRGERPLVGRKPDVFRAARCRPPRQAGRLTLRMGSDGCALQQSDTTELAVPEGLRTADASFLKESSRRTRHKGCTLRRRSLIGEWNRPGFSVQRQHSHWIFPNPADRLRRTSQRFILEIRLGRIHPPVFARITIIVERRDVG